MKPIFNLHSVPAMGHGSHGSKKKKFTYVSARYTIHKPHTLGVCVCVDVDSTEECLLLRPSRVDCVSLVCHFTQKPTERTCVHMAPWQCFYIKYKFTASFVPLQAEGKLCETVSQETILWHVYEILPAKLIFLFSK